MKKLVFCLVILTVVMALVASGCGTSSSPTQTTTTTAPTTTTPQSSSTTTKPAQTSTTPPPSLTSTTTVPATATPKSGGKVTIMTGVLPDGIFGYPPEVVNGASVRISGHTLETLVKMGWDGQLSPLLAESWEIAGDQLSITFHLKKGIKFTDGTELNAQAVKWNYDNIIAAKKVAVWKSVEVINPYTVKVNFTQYFNTNLQTFCDSTGWIVSPTAYEKNGKQWLYLNSAGTAAFMVDKFERDVKVLMKKNPNYWQTGKPYLDELQYTFVTDNLTAWAFLQTGGADVWWTGAQWLAQANDKNFKNVTYVGATISLIPDSVNPESPWSNLKVRQAAEYAIDREAIAKALGYGLTQATYQIAPRGSVEYDPNFAGRKYDPAKSKQLLTEAGYPTGFKTNLICQVSSNTNNNEVLAIQAYLKAVGINAEVAYYETAKYYEYRNGKWKNGLLLEPIAAFGNYNSTLNMYFRPNGPTFQSLARSDAWVAALNATMTSTYVDTDLMRKAVKVISDEVMAIPTSESLTCWVLQPDSKIQNLGLLTRHSALFFNAEEAWIEK